MARRMYLSGPTSAHPEGVDVALASFDKAKIELGAMGWEIISPADNQQDGWTWKQYMKLGIQQMLECEAVCLLPGWLMSPGASLERRVAGACGLEVRELRDWLDPMREKK